MNRFYLLIPAIDEEDAGQEIAYLNLIGDVNVDDVVSKKTSLSFSMMQSAFKV